jgi:membrane associated rhomboid family serine protease
MRIRYNAPVTLSFAIIATLVLVINQASGGSLTATFFSIPGKGAFSFTNPINILRLFSHIAGHSSWNHLMNNFAFILLLGPILEEKYGSGNLLIMVLLTALITGLINVMFFTTGLLGASGVVFMMILLISFTNIRQGEIPLTFILILALYLTREILGTFEQNTISEVAHIAGGICGSLFGFMRPRKVKA